jgi:hypothetical protein
LVSIVYYELGVSEEDPAVPIKVPATDKLKMLEKDAFDAALVMMSDGTEIARFDLINK